MANTEKVSQNEADTFFIAGHEVLLKGTSGPPKQSAQQAERSERTGSGHTQLATGTSVSRAFGGQNGVATGTSVSRAFGGRNGVAMRYPMTSPQGDTGQG
jgi:hypothetical protein